MSGIDLFISKSLAKIIKENLDSDIEKRIMLKLFNKHGLSIKQSIEDFPKLHQVLEEFLGTKTLQFEKKCISKIIEFTKQKNGSVILTIKDLELEELILKILGDIESRIIIEKTLKKPLMISEIISDGKLSKTSGYRKINSLIQEGIIIKSGYKMTEKKRAIDKLGTLCDSFEIRVDKDKYTVKLHVSQKIFESSTTIKTIMN